MEMMIEFSADPPKMPPPVPELAELFPTTVQFIRSLPEAPPPCWAALLASRQLINVPETAPPPWTLELLFVMTQFRRLLA